jgi:hypothetical protein
MMKNIIKKILKESELDWIQNQNPEPWEEFMFPYTELEGKLENLRFFGEWVFYRDLNGEWVFYHEPIKNAYVYFNYTKIWKVFRTQFGFENEKIQELLRVWLGEHYNLRGVTTRINI